MRKEQDVHIITAAKYLGRESDTHLPLPLQLAALTNDASLSRRIPRLYAASFTNKGLTSQTVFVKIKPARLGSYSKHF